MTIHMPRIHSSAIVSERAELHPSVRVGPFSIIEAGVKIGAGSVLENNVRIFEHVHIGAHNRICHGVAIGAAPQHLGYTPDQAGSLRIGDHNTFKENVVISLGMKTAQGTRIGNRNYLMNGAHIGHDCSVGDDNVIASNSIISGHVEIGDHVFLSVLVAVHQFCRIGAHAMVGRASGVVQDIPPYVMSSGSHARFVGVNTVGLKRSGFTPEQRRIIQRAYRILLRSGLSRPSALAKLQALPQSDELRAIIAFAEASERGLIPAVRG